MRNTLIILSTVVAVGLGGAAFQMSSQSAGGKTTLLAAAQQSAAIVSNSDPKSITWEDLLPEGELKAAPLGPPPDFFKGNSNPLLSSETGGIPEPMMSVPLPTAEPRQDMSDSFVKIAGYMTPLNVEAGKTRTFLLVPYVGACIHVPAPPANQIILVEAVEPVEVREMWTPFEAVGTLHVENISTNLAEVSYTMDLDRIEPYVLED